MLAGMRNHVHQGITTLIFGAIIVTFALNFGPGSVAQCGGRVPRAAAVGGRVISEAEFLRVYRNEFDRRVAQRSMMGGGTYTVENAKAEGLKSTVLDQMIGNELLAQEAERRGLATSPDEIREYIKKIPAFQTDGKFDREKYRNYAKYAALTEAKFEEDLARELVIQKMRDILSDLVVVSPAEIKESWESQNNRADAEFVKFDPAFFKKDLKISDDDAKKLIAEDHKALEEYYNQHASRYNEPRKVRARHILAKATEGDAESEKKAREKIESAKARLDKGEDFATVAKEMSEDGSAANGGDLGLQGPGVWVKPFEDEANRLKAGETGGIIRSRFGFHIIKVDEVRDASKRELKDVEMEVAKLVLETRMTKEAARKEAERVLAEVKAGKTLEQLFPAPKENEKPDPLAPKVESTGMFSRSATKYVPRLGVAPDVSAAVFAADKPGLLEKTWEVNDRFYVVNVKTRELPDPAKFADERDQIEERLKAQMRFKVVADFIKQRRTENERFIEIEKDALSYDVVANQPNPMDGF